MKNQSGKRSSPKTPSIEKRLIGYGTMSMAIAVALAPNASAGTFYWEPDATTPYGGGLYFNVLSETYTTQSQGFLTPETAQGSFFLSNEVASSRLKAWVGAGGSNNFAVSAGLLYPQSSSAARLTLNAIIGSSRHFAQYFGSLASNVAPSYAVGHWNTLGTGYLGLEFENGSQIDYGWAEITINPETYQITLDATSYESTGAQSVAGDVPPIPEPDSLWLMSLGAAGLAAYRRRIQAIRAKAAKAAQ